MGPNKGYTERACQSNYQGVITTGGGFSTYFQAPSFQHQAINSFIENTVADGHTPASGYNVQGSV